MRSEFSRFFGNKRKSAVWCRHGMFFFTMCMPMCVHICPEADHLRYLIFATPCDTVICVLLPHICVLILTHCHQVVLLAALRIGRPHHACVFLIQARPLDMLLTIPGGSSIVVSVATDAPDQSE